MIPESHRGAWKGPNRLWLEPPKSVRSDGALIARADELEYTWSHEGKPHSGRLRWFGPDGALRAGWQDTFHHAEPTTLHGYAHNGVLHLFCTYPAGDTEWGWRMTVDWTDPDHLVLRMYNVVPPRYAPPSGKIEIAAELRGER